jgi:hypothetical protein
MLRWLRFRCQKCFRVQHSYSILGRRERHTCRDCHELPISPRIYWCCAPIPATNWICSKSRGIIGTKEVGAKLGHWVVSSRTRVGHVQAKVWICSQALCTLPVTQTWKSKEVISAYLVHLRWQLLFPLGHLFPSNIPTGYILGMECSSVVHALLFVP